MEMGMKMEMEMEMGHTTASRTFTLAGVGASCMFAMTGVAISFIHIMRTCGVDGR